MNRHKWYGAAFVGCIVPAVIMAFTFVEPITGWRIMLIMVFFGAGMYFQGRWHESEANRAETLAK